MIAEIEEFPYVPAMMLKHAKRNREIARQYDIREVVIPLIETASREEMQQIMQAIMVRIVAFDGCAPEIEDWLCENAREIAILNKEAAAADLDNQLCSQCNGSGEGRGDGEICTACKGTGG